MRAVVTALFVDRDNELVSYPVGTVVDFDEKRIKDLAERELVRILDEPKAEPKAKPEEVKRARKCSKKSN